MKSTFLLMSMIILILICGFINIFSNDCVAENGNYAIFIKDTSTNLVDTLEKGGTIYEYYDIKITMHNSGDAISDDIAVKIMDAEGFNDTINKTIRPGEDEIYLFSNYPLMGVGAHKLDVSYYATELDKRNDYNSGLTTINIGTTDNKNNDSTPGFEIVVLVCGIFLFLSLKKYKRK